MSATRKRSGVGERSLAELVGDALGAMAEELVVQECVEAHSRAGGSGIALCSQAPLQDITFVISRIGQYVRNPGFDLRAQLLTRAPTADFDPAGDGVDSLMAWLDGLSHLMIQRVCQEVADAEESFDADALRAVFERLYEGLQTMTSVAVTRRLDRDAHRHGELLRRLADFNLTLRHELRSPLNSILLSANILASATCGSEVRQKQLTAIRSAIAHAEVLLLDAEKLTNAQSGEGLARVTSLQWLFESLSAELGLRARAAGVTLLFQASAPAVAVETVVTQLVLSNLVVNAIKYADGGKPERWVKVRAKSVEADASTVVVEVADNGLGIPAHLQHRVFARHFRAHPHVAEGMGLGLALTREILSARGGDIDLVSEEGVGTTVRAMFRTAPVRQIPRGTAKSVPAGMPTIDAQRLTV